MKKGLSRKHWWCVSLLCLSAFCVIFSRKCQAHFALWRRKISVEWPTCVSLPPEPAECDKLPHRAENGPALCPDKGAHPCLTSHALSSDMDRLSPKAQPSSRPARSGNICDRGTKSTSQVSIRKTLRSSETHVTKPMGSKLLILK